MENTFFQNVEYVINSGVLFLHISFLNIKIPSGHALEPQVVEKVVFLQIY